MVPTDVPSPTAIPVPGPDRGPAPGPVVAPGPALAPGTGGVRYLAPGGLVRRVMNPVVVWSTRRGVSVWGSRVLVVAGRSSGQPRSTPVNLLQHAGERYLVAPRGQTQWVRNLRAAGAGELVVGRRREAFRAEELADAAKPEVVRAYLRRWALEVGVFFEGLDARSDDARIAEAAPGLPVFRVLAPR